MCMITGMASLKFGKMNYSWGERLMSANLSICKSLQGAVDFHAQTGAAYWCYGVQYKKMRNKKLSFPQITVGPDINVMELDPLAP